jgi:hypothetical protein
MMAQNARNVYNHLLRRHTADRWSVYRHSCASLKYRTDKSVDVKFAAFRGTVQSSARGYSDTVVRTATCLLAVRLAVS